MPEKCYNTSLYDLTFIQFEITQLYIFYNLQMLHNFLFLMMKVLCTLYVMYYYERFPNVCFSS